MDVVYSCKVTEVAGLLQSAALLQSKHLRTPQQSSQHVILLLLGPWVTASVPDTICEMLPEMIRAVPGHHDNLKHTTVDCHRELQ